jgi:hypothetical protein
MNVTYACPRCRRSVQCDILPAAEKLACPHCQLVLELPCDAVRGGQLTRCLACPSTDLYIRKAFPQRLGVAIVVVGFAVSCVFWYFHRPIATFGVLFATAIIDALLFLLMGNVLSCYRCGAVYRRVEDLHNHGPFNLQVHERHRQQQARLDEHRAGSVHSS